MAKVERPTVPVWMVRRLAAILDRFPGCVQEDAWTGVRWRVGQATVAHVFGGEDGLFRVTFRARPDEVAAMEHLGPPYFRSGWGGDVVGVVLDEHSDFEELTELLTDSFCVQAPRRLVQRLDLPDGQG